jgi:nitrogen regulatory protein P-II 1
MAEVFKKLEIIVRPGKMDAVKKAMAAAGYTGMTVSQAEGHGAQNGVVQSKQGGTVKMDLVPKIRLESVVPQVDVEKLIQAISRAAQTGAPGDGKIFVYDVQEVVRIRTGERGAKAL